jgi:hypothetical protein
MLSLEWFPIRINQSCRVHCWTISRRYAPVLSPGSAEWGLIWKQIFAVAIEVK